MSGTRWLWGATLAAVTACHPAGPGHARLTPREQAQVLLQRGDGAGAVALLESLHRDAPSDLSIARALAEAHVKAGTGAALLARLQPIDTAVSHYQQGLVRFARAADASGPAIDSFRRAVALAPEEPEFKYRLGVALLESEQHEAAREALEAATRAAPELVAWQLPLAKARANTGDPRGALSAITAVVTHAPTEPEVATARALMERLSDPFAGLPRAARTQLEQAMQWLEVADVPQQAIDQLEALRLEYPDQAVVHALLGLSWARLDDVGRAVEELRRAIELAPEDGKNHFYLAELYAGRQRPRQAEEHYLQAVERNPLLERAWFALGDLALERQDYVSARRHFGVATHLAPADSAARGKLALVLQLEGDYAGADRALRAVLDREPDNVEFMLRLGVLHTERFTRARSATEREQAATEAGKWLEKVLEAQPENALASRALERVRRR